MKCLPAEVSGSSAGVAVVLARVVVPVICDGLCLDLVRVLEPMKKMIEEGRVSKTSDMEALFGSLKFMDESLPLDAIIVGGKAFLDAIPGTDISFAPPVQGQLTTSPGNDEKVVNGLAHLVLTHPTLRACLQLLLHTIRKELVGLFQGNRLSEQIVKEYTDHLELRGWVFEEAHRVHDACIFAGTAWDEKSGPDGLLSSYRCLHSISAGDSFLMLPASHGPCPISPELTTAVRLLTPTELL
ncbi:hypothetical protein GNI_153030 [Gregarina niphandrodes]|uniref:Uncharacterized protein n=1 Tax=Gregarina niphandrodes TaxID=110365 RepID=A0A023AZE7_GRENI|nr:hypothetical protein GNI_153030 [Gregarina niphandrodes]EZG44056.1 hypothetical protein GNI_153030 [Gregarina niphandrodes]|eukprot:XP_011132831.1 hypothetical protein GNI_153030 [Gregarina niphandrodes]